jgi:hypothetical protein
VNIVIDNQHRSGALVRIDDGLEFLIPKYNLVIEGDSPDDAQFSFEAKVEVTKTELDRAAQKKHGTFIVCIFNKRCYQQYGKYIIDAEIGIGAI